MPSADPLGSTPPRPERHAAGVVRRLLREPALHFFVLGAALFAAHRLALGDPMTIRVTPGLKADLARRFHDDTGRAPTRAEQAKVLSDWKRDEALYRQALAEKLDHNDRAIRGILIDKLRARAVQQVPQREPTEAELTDWLAQHRSLYERPRRYALEWFAFAKAQPAASEERRLLAGKLQAGADTRFLGRPLFGANLTVDELRLRLGDALADKVAELPLGQWQTSEDAGELLLVRINAREGGLPPLSELRPRLRVECAAAIRQREAEKLLKESSARYHFEETP